MIDREVLGIIFLAIVSLFVLLWFSTSIVGWVWAVQRLIRKQSLVAIEPRAGLRPGLSDLFFAFGCFIVCLYGMQMLLVVPKMSEIKAKTSANTDFVTETPNATPLQPGNPSDGKNPSEAMNPGTDLSEDSVSGGELSSSAKPAENLTQQEVEKSEEGGQPSERTVSSLESNKRTASVAENKSTDEDLLLEHPQIITRGIVAQSIASVLATLATILWMLLNRIGLVEGGLAPRIRDFKVGALGVVLFLPPIYLLQGFLVRFYPYEHKILDMLKEPQAWHIFLAMGISTTLVAPICEEFFFRGLFQSWLESMGRRKDALREVPPRWPIFFSSLLFALAHFGQGPAPISLFFLALGLGYLYRQTGNIWAGVFVHMTLNGITTGVLLASNLLGIQP